MRSRPLLTVLGWLCFAGTAISAGETATSPTAGNRFAVPDEAAFFACLSRTGTELPADLYQAIDAGNWSRAKELWAGHLQTRQRPVWLWSHHDLPAIKELFAARFGGFGAEVPAADKVLAREFTFNGVTKILSPLNWTPTSNEWTVALNRHDCFHTLGLAYWATGDERYSRDFVFLLKDWIAASPVPPEVKESWGLFGQSWRTLETGIRMRAWLNAMQLFMDAPAFDAEAKYLMSRSLIEHARRLFERNDAFHQGNWQVAECSGLAETAMAFPEYKESGQWLERALALLSEHMEKDVYPDGAHWEVTPGYHSWVTQEYAEVSRLCQLNGHVVPALTQRHEKMFDFIMEIAKPDERYPPLGDAGIGQSNIHDLMGVGTLLYKRSDFRALAGPGILSDWVWIFGPQVEAQYAALPVTPPPLGSCLLPDARYAVMRTGWNPADKYLLFNAAPWGGGHNHLDRMEIVLYAGRDLLIDPGMYSYDEPLSRTYFRTSQAHNVVLIDGREEPSPPQAKILSWHAAPEADFVAGELLEPDGGRHQRSVFFVRPDYWVVVDHVYGSGEHEISRRFHLPSGAAATVKGQAVRTGFATGTNLEIADLSDGKVLLEDGWVPTGPATAEKGQVVTLTNRATLPAVFCTVLTPFEDASRLPGFERVVANNPLVCKLRSTFPDGRRDDIAVAAESRPLHLEGKESEGRAFLVRSEKKSQMEIRVGD